MLLGYGWGECGRGIETESWRYVDQKSNEYGWIWEVNIHVPLYITYLSSWSLSCVMHLKCARTLLLPQWYLRYKCNYLVNILTFAQIGNSEINSPIDWLTTVLWLELRHDWHICIVNLIMWYITPLYDKYHKLCQLMFNKEFPPT